VLHRRLTITRAARGTLDEAWLFIRKPYGGLAQNIFWLDAQGDLPRAARRLFAQLRELDGAGYTRIHVETAPPGSGGPAIAINDRLRRAAAK
jgi:hypothetical protein